MAVKKLTMIAAQAVGLAEVFQAVFAEGLQGPVPYKVELSEPDGPSTAGGKLAMQHLKLIPASGAGPTIVMGSANTVDKTVELRTFHYLSSQHSQRFKGASLPVNAEKYKDLLKLLQGFFTDRGMTVVMLDAPKPERNEDASPMVPQQATSSSTMIVLAALGGALLVVVVGAIVFFALK
jgi:hypothetical protein